MKRSSQGEGKIARVVSKMEENKAEVKREQDGHIRRIEGRTSSVRF